MASPINHDISLNLWNSNIKNTSKYTPSTSKVKFYCSNFILSKYCKAFYGVVDAFYWGYNLCNTKAAVLCSFGIAQVVSSVK